MRQARTRHHKFARSDRVGEVVKRELAHYFMEGHLRLKSGKELVLTVTHVRLSGDLQHARVFVQELGKDHCNPDVLELLNLNSFRIKKEISRRLGLRHTPQLIFEQDVHLAASDRLYQIIKTISASESENA